MSKSKKGVIAPQTEEQDKPDPAILTGPAGCGVTAQARRLACVMGLEIKLLQHVREVDRGVLHVTTEDPAIIESFAPPHVRVIPFKHALRTAAEIEQRQAAQAELSASVDAALDREKGKSLPRRYVGRNATLFVGNRRLGRVTTEGLRA